MTFDEIMNEYDAKLAAANAANEARYQQALASMAAAQSNVSNINQQALAAQGVSGQNVNNLYQNALNALTQTGTNVNALQKQAQQYQNIAASNVANRYRAAEDLISGIGTSGIRSIRDLESQQRAQAEQSAVSRGLGNTTVVDSLKRGVSYDAQKSINSLLELLAGQRANVLTQQAGADLSLAGLQSNLSGQNINSALNLGAAQAGTLSNQAQAGLSLAQQQAALYGQQANSATTLAGMQNALYESKQDNAPDANLYAQLMMGASQSKALEQQLASQSQNSLLANAPKTASGTPIVSSSSGTMPTPSWEKTSATAAYAGAPSANASSLSALEAAQKAYDQAVLTQRDISDPYRNARDYSNQQRNEAAQATADAKAALDAAKAAVPKKKATGLDHGGTGGKLGGASSGKSIWGGGFDGASSMTSKTTGATGAGNMAANAAIGSGISALSNTKPTGTSLRGGSSLPMAGNTTGATGAGNMAANAAIGSGMSAMQNAQQSQQLPAAATPSDIGMSFDQWASTTSGDTGATGQMADDVLGQLGLGGMSAGDLLGVETPTEPEQGQDSMELTSIPKAGDVIDGLTVHHTDFMYLTDDGRLTNNPTKNIAGTRVYYNRGAKGEGISISASGYPMRFYKGLK